tara:strand:+ start:814 stop:1518 length:705 start_codon:yes stop_codon:yes gene_type:complete
MKYQIEEYKDHFKIAEQITVPCVVTPKWYQFWKSATTIEHEVWAHMRRASDSLLNEFLSGSELKFKTKEKAQKHIDNLIKKSNEPKVKYPIIHEVADNESCSSSVSFKLSVLTPCTESDAERIKLALNIDDNALTDLIFSASVFGVRPDQIINSVLNGREGLKKHFELTPNSEVHSFEGRNYTYKELTKLQHETLKRRKVDVLRLRDLERLIKKIDSETPASSMDRWTATFIKT